MRRKARTDANHAEIVDALRQIGASVCDLSRVGSGCPDLLVGYRGVNLPLEVKDGSKPPSRQKLTPLEMEFRRSWRGTVRTVCSVTEALDVVMRMGRRGAA